MFSIINLLKDPHQHLEDNFFVERLRQKVIGTESSTMNTFGFGGNSDFICSDWRTIWDMVYWNESIQQKRSLSLIFIQKSIKG